MKTVKETLLERVSCRRYEREPITTEQLEFIYEAIRNTPTSYNGQQFSVVDVDDQNIKLELEALIGQKQIKTCSHFMAFCMDFHKIKEGAKAKGIEMPHIYDTVDGVTLGIIDASTSMMSAIVAANALGLGCCPIGYARTRDQKEIARILRLPEHVMVVCGLAIGVPREHNDLKPKQPTDLMIFRNSYPQSGIAEQVIDYDAVVTRYNETRSGATTDNDWVAHIISYYQEAMKYQMLEALRERGFDCDH
ncbi:MAG: nitroreductase family protein [Bacteroidales bacterium]|nr:nitroreductase family protein [Bacteroidales bacterium]